MWAVIKGKEVIKTYPFKLQCVVWCYEKGLVWDYGKFGNQLRWDLPYYIVEVEGDEWE